MVVRKVVGLVFHGGGALAAGVPGTAVVTVAVDR